MSKRSSFILTGDKVKSEIDFANSGIELEFNKILNGVIRDLKAEGPGNIKGARETAITTATDEFKAVLGPFIKELVETSVAKPVETFADAQPDAKFRWVLGQVKTEHCPDCLMLSKKGALTKKQWLALGYGLPRHGKTECNVGCKCMLVPADQKEKPSEKANRDLQKNVDGPTGAVESVLAPSYLGKHKKTKDVEALVQHNLKMPEAKFGSMPVDTATEVAQAFNNIAKKYRTRADLPRNILQGGDEWVNKKVNEKYPITFEGQKINPPFSTSYYNFSSVSMLERTYVRRLSKDAVAEAGSGKFMGFSSNYYGKSSSYATRREAEKSSFKTGWSSSYGKGSVVYHEYGHIFTANHIDYNTAIGKRFNELRIAWLDDKNQLTRKFRDRQNEIDRLITKQDNWFKRNRYKYHQSQKISDMWDQKLEERKILLDEKKTNRKKYLKEAGDLTISEYATTNTHEFVAESFACYMLGGKEARNNKYIQQVGEIIDEMYKK